MINDTEMDGPELKEAINEHIITGMLTLEKLITLGKMCPDRDDEVIATWEASYQDLKDLYHGRKSN